MKAVLTEPIAATLDLAWGELVDVVPATPDLQDREDGKARRLAKALRAAGGSLDRYEVVLVDCPPSLGNLTTNALAAARHALVVVEPSALGLRGIGGVADTIDQVWDHHNPDLELSGVVLNRVAGARHERILRDNIEHYCGIPVVGAIPKLKTQIFPERHMGLVPTPEHDWAAESTDTAASIAGEHIDLDAIYGDIQNLPPLKETADSGQPATSYIRPELMSKAAESKPAARSQ